MGMGTGEMLSAMQNVGSAPSTGGGSGTVLGPMYENQGLITTLDQALQKKGGLVGTVAGGIASIENTVLKQLGLESAGIVSMFDIGKLSPSAAMNPEKAFSGLKSPSK